MANKKIYFSIIFISLAVFTFSCKKSPATYVMGTYEGNYLMDSISVGEATANVVDVNSLTVNIGMDFQNHPDYTLTDVEVNGEEDVYFFTYTGIEGTMVNGKVDHDNMLFTLYADTDTIQFSGVRQ